MVPESGFYLSDAGARRVLKAQMSASLDKDLRSAALEQQLHEDEKQIAHDDWVKRWGIPIAVILAAAAGAALDHEIEQRR